MGHGKSRIGSHRWEIPLAAPTQGVTESRGWSRRGPEGPPLRPHHSPCSEVLRQHRWTVALAVA
eukprot:12923623-Prorocentrum_lima.AAC.1